MQRAWCSVCRKLGRIAILKDARRNEHRTAYYVSGYLDCEHAFSIVTSPEGLERIRKQVKP